MLKGTTRYYVINYHGSPLVIIENSDHILGEWLLDWYSKIYAMPREALTLGGSWIPVIKCEDPLPIKKD